MAKVKCEYCGSFIEDTEETCSVCGAVNDLHHRVARDTPQTIEELQSWYKARKLPPEETTRFFIGRNILEPRAFGIYEDNGTFIVYKNKADGSRAVRYQGTDEAYAVNEIYLKLKEEILRQKNINLNKKQQRPPSYRPPVSGSYSPPQRYVRSSRKTSLLPFIAFLIIFIFSITTIIPLFSVFNDIFSTDSSGYFLG